MRLRPFGCEVSVCARIEEDDLKGRGFLRLCLVVNLYAALRVSGMRVSQDEELVQSHERHTDRGHSRRP